MYIGPANTHTLTSSLFIAFIRVLQCVCCCAAMLRPHNDGLWRDDAKGTSMAWVSASAASEDVYTAWNQRAGRSVCVRLVGGVCVCCKEDNLIFCGQTFMWIMTSFISLRKHSSESCQKQESLKQEVLFCIKLFRNDSMRWWLKLPCGPWLRAQKCVYERKRLKWCQFVKLYF